MTTVAHALSGGLIAATAAGVSPDQTRYLWIAVVAAGIADLDHVWPVIRDWKFYRQHGLRGNLHGARSRFHEMYGLLAAGIVGALLFPLDARLGMVVFTAYAVHLAQDFVLGRSMPFAPYDRTPVQMFAVPFRVKAAVDVAVILASAVLWLTFLSGRS